MIVTSSILVPKGRIHAPSIGSKPQTSILRAFVNMRFVLVMISGALIVLSGMLQVLYLTSSVDFFGNQSPAGSMWLGGLVFCWLATARQRWFQKPDQNELTFWGIGLGFTIGQLVLFDQNAVEIDQLFACIVAIGTITFLALSQVALFASLKYGAVLWCAAAVIPLIEVSGLIMGRNSIFSGMPVMIAVTLIMLVMANTLRFVRHTSVRSMLGKTSAGRLIRRQILLIAMVFLIAPLFLRPEFDSVRNMFPIVHTLENVVMLGLGLYFATQFVGLYEKQRGMNRILEKSLKLDSLTQADTRQSAIDWFNSHSRQRSIGLALLDIDHFKSINDTFGHNTGDEVLKAVVKTLRSELRLGDVVARWGGEEFLIMVEVSGDEALMRLVDRLRVSLYHAAAPYGVERISGSFGALMVHPHEYPDLDASIASADKALYQAKATGRDRAILAKDIPADYMRDAIKRTRVA